MGWSTDLKIEQLTKGMTAILRSKILTATTQDPWDKSLWTFESLKEQIKKHAISPTDPSKLAAGILTKNEGRNIEETNEMIEDWLEELEQATQAQGEANPNMDENKRKIEVERFSNKTVKEALKWLILRATLKKEILSKVRVHEISSNEGLGLDNSAFITLVKQLEKNKGNNTDQVNKFEISQSQQRTEGRQQNWAINQGNRQNNGN